MEHEVLVSSKYVIGYKELGLLDLSNLPEIELPSPKRDDKKPVCLGFVTFYKSSKGYGFLVTYGENLDPQDQSRSVQEVYFKKSDWKSDEQISVGICVTFTMTGSKSRSKANDVCPIICTQEIYALVELHVGKYASIIGTTRYDSKRYYFQKTIHNLFLSTEEGKSIVLRNLLTDLQSQKDVAYSVLSDYIDRDARIEQLLTESLPNLNSPEEKETVESLYLAQLSRSLYDYNVTVFQEKLTLLTFDKCKALFWEFVNQKMLTSSEKCQKFLAEALLPETLISYLSYPEYHPNSVVRIYLTTLTKTTNWIKHPSVVSEFNNLADVSYVSLLNIWNKVLSLGKQQEKELACFIAESSIATDKLKWYVFLMSGVELCYRHIKEIKPYIELVHTLSPDIICRFLLSTSEILAEEEYKDLLLLLGSDAIANGIKRMEEDHQYQYVSELPDEIGKEVVYNHFKKTNLFDTYIKDQWDKCKSEVPYMAFDIETDGEVIKEFAILKGDNIRPYSSEEQLSTLGRAIARTPIVVGHNIRQWDLPILEKKEYTTKSFVWDTLEIEILLNPCRYAYSLHTTHNATDDVELTNDLFWNQLYRLSLRPDLCNSLKEFLPKELNSIIETLQQPVFKDFFEKTATQKDRFFQELRPLSVKLSKDLSRISQIPSEERTLIVAPNNLWPRIAQVIPLQFPGHEKDYQLMSVDADMVKIQPFDNPLSQKILLRFCEESRTPIVANIPQYLRTEGDKPSKITFSDEFLRDYLKVSESHIDCIDIDSFENPTITSTDYQHIFVIGIELHDRIHKCCIATWSFADLLARGCKLPFAMASTNFAVVKDDDLEKLNITNPKLAANFWAERNWDNTFSRNSIINYSDFIR